MTCHDKFKSLQDATKLSEKIGMDNNINFQVGLFIRNMIKEILLTRNATLFLHVFVDHNIPFTITQKHPKGNTMRK